MAVNYLNQDITTVNSGIIAHGVNCQGVMGSGVAKTIRNKWPIVYTEYMKQPMSKEMLGHINMVYIADDLFVANCFTQEFYGREKKKYADIDAVSKCLEECVFFSKTLALPLYMPKIGCGLGGLDWDQDVKLIVYNLAQSVNINVCEI